MSPTFTHTFELSIGGQAIEGSMEFNEDGQASYQTDDALPNLTVDQSARIVALMAELKRLFDAFGSIDKIEIAEI